MSKKRTLQIDVKDCILEGGSIVKMVLSVDGRDCAFYMSKPNYEALVSDGFFIRDGKTKDSANCINTTKVYIEN